MVGASNRMMLCLYQLYSYVLPYQGLLQRGSAVYIELLQSFIEEKPSPLRTVEQICCTKQEGICIRQ